MNAFKLLTMILFVFLGQTGQCCINEYRTLLNGEVIFKEAGNSAPSGRFNSDNKSYLLEKLHEADSIYKLSGKLSDYSDLGAMLIYTGNYLKAKKIFLAIERERPGLYQTASNLGTTYELLGQNKLALYWIKKAITINPNSHEGSEWIHVKILEAKIKAKGNKKYFSTHSILSLDFGNNLIPENKNNLDLKELGGQLYQQLKERMSFVKPKDPIVGQLLFDFGNIMALRSDATGGFQNYKLAKEYGYTSELFERRFAYFEDLQSKADFKNYTDNWVKDNLTLFLIIVATIFFGGIIGIIFLIVRIKKWFKAKKNNNL